MFLEINGVRLHTVAFGAGSRTLVATGGWTGSWEVWEEPIEQLSAAGWRCIAYDHRGSGESPVDPALITVDALVEDVVGVLDTLGVGTCILAGESQGGAIAQYVAARHPERIDGLVLAAPAPTGQSTAGPSAFADACRTDYGSAVAGFVDRCFPEPDIPHIRRWATDILLRAEPEHAARMIDMWRDDDVPDVDPHSIEVRALVLHGTGDVIVPIEHSRELVGLLPDAELVEFEGSGHVPTMTRPLDVVDAVLRRFPG
jgi:pimeloyl-ACP methyl ester carboxylesterase